MGEELVVTTNRMKNQALVSYVVLPFLFLTVVLLGGLRVNADDRAFIFLPPSLVTLVLAVLLVLLFVRGGLIDLRSLIAGANSPLTNLAHTWMLLTAFFASAQAFNSVLPERGLFHWLFSFFFLWTLWNNQFSSFDARRLLRSLVVLFGTTFLLKHLLLASLHSTDGGWLKKPDQHAAYRGHSRHAGHSPICTGHRLHFFLHTGAFYHRVDSAGVLSATN